MKKNFSPFTLTRKALPAESSSAVAERAVTGVISKQSPELAKQFAKLNPMLRNAVTTSVLSVPILTKGAKKPTLSVSGSIVAIAREVGRQKKVYTVGILDLGAWLSGLPRVLDHLNRAQPLITFFEVQAAIPAGLIKSQKHLVDWAVHEQGVALSKSERADVEKNILANEFFRAAKDIKKSLGLDYLAGMTPAMVAGVDRDGVYWNHFSSHDGPVLLVSTAGLRGFAADAGRPFEAAVGSLLVAQLLVAMVPKLRYHADRGCIFDYNADRKSLAVALKNPRIDPECLEKMEPDVRQAAVALVNALRRL